MFGSWLREKEKQTPSERRFRCGTKYRWGAYCGTAAAQGFSSRKISFRRRKETRVKLLYAFHWPSLDEELDRWNGSDQKVGCDL